MRPIGVFDSGMGGLTVLRALHARLPGEDLIYFGDTARVPYGSKGARTVQMFACQDAAFLATHGVKLIVVACNTASAFAMEHLRASFALPFLDVIGPGVETALRCSRGGRIGVIGTSGTIRSRRYQDTLAATLGSDRIVARECPLFVPLVEEGMTDHPITRLAVAEYLTDLKEREVDTLILGCTHYPLLKPAIARFMGPGVALVDSADALAEAAAALLAANGLLAEEIPDHTVSPPDQLAADRAQTALRGPAREGKLSFFLSDIPWKFTEVGARFLGKPITDVTTVNLDEAEAAGRLASMRKDRV